LLAERFQRLAAGSEAAGDVTLALESVAQGAHMRGLIVDDEESRRRCAHA